jgi:Aspartyl/Asparaginyl beta-hydroxylase
MKYSGENKCRITVGDETREWINGKVLVFDTSLLHDAVNESDKMMFRFWHPDLTQAGGDALQFTYDCLEIPGLVSDNPEERFLSEQIAKSVRALPAIDSKSKGSGFGEKNSKSKKQKSKSEGKKGFGS